MGKLSRHNKNWTLEEDDYLRENVGKKRLEVIGKHLKRSGRAVQDRLVHLGISHTTFATGMFTAAAIANALNTDSHVPLRWINKYGLKAGDVVTANSRVLKQDLKSPEELYAKYSISSSEIVSFECKSYPEYSILA